MQLGTVTDASARIARGWIADSTPGDMDFFRFEVDASVNAIYVDVDFGDDALATDNRRDGLDAGIWIFDELGRLRARNDDSESFRSGIDNEGLDPGSDAQGEADAFIGALPVSSGAYYAAVGWYGHRANGELQNGLVSSGLSDSGIGIANTLPDASIATRPCADAEADQCAGGYELAVRTTFLPEPALGVALGLGALLAASLRRP